MDFLKDFEKEVSKLTGVAGSSQPPAYWYSFGNYALNRIMSGDFNKGLPQGRIIGFAGPSGAGKSFLVGNIIKNAQEQGAFCFVIDSENALDDDYMTKIGVDVNTKYLYKSVITINHVETLVSKFISNYRKEYGVDNPEAPRVVIAIDSLDMLLTESELENYERGRNKGDQGQRSKQLKAMLRRFVQDIKNLNVSMVVTSQVYVNQDPLNGEGKWMVPEAIRYALSQIVLITNLKLKDTGGSVNGIRMKCEGKKTRFTKPFQSVVIEVPYDEGMNPYSGLLEALISLDVVKRKGSWYRCEELDLQFRASEIDKHADKLIEIANKRSETVDATEIVKDMYDEDMKAPSTRIGFITEKIKEREESSGED